MQSGGQTQILQVAWAKIEIKTPNLFNGGIDKLEDLLYLPFQGNLLRQQLLFHGFYLELQRQQGMPQFIVKLTGKAFPFIFLGAEAVSYTHLRAHETDSYLVCRL